MPQMISKQLNHYAGRSLKAGERFEAHAEFVAVLQIAGLADLAVNVEPAVYQTRVMKHSKKRDPDPDLGLALPLASAASAELK